MHLDSGDDLEQAFDDFAVATEIRLANEDRFAPRLQEALRF